MKAIKLYTDGACAGNPGRGGWSAIAYDGNDNIMQHGGGYRHTTNNRMEILAVAEGLIHLSYQLGEARDTDIKVTVCSDSQLVINTMTKNWSPSKNLDLWERLYQAVKNCQFLGIEVEFVKVKGHNDDERNNYADEVAVAYTAPEKATNIDWSYEKISGYAEKKAESEDVSAQDEGDGTTPVYDPVITEIRFKNANVKELRSIEVDLSNGTTVIIEACWGGFQQYNCTTAESAITVEVAQKFSSWLNGGNL